mmetsp:Transcript_59306/g.159791  ORF Transcript_59306/g.159791 Transcript_59306/m.159791 type:complete len:99 (+) Transcript_59306:6-302(+)
MYRSRRHLPTSQRLDLGDHYLRAEFDHTGGHPAPALVLLVPGLASLLRPLPPPRASTAAGTGDARGLEEAPPSRSAIATASAAAKPLRRQPPKLESAK